MFSCRSFRYLTVLLLLLLAPLSRAALPAQLPGQQPLPSLAPMLEQVNPAVVNIATYSTTQSRYNPLFNDPFFRRFFNIPEQELPRKAERKRQQSAGSGVIVDASEGIVMTNYHVVKGADEVRVGLVDGRGFDARIIGTDPALDIAILKVEADGLTEVKMADSSQLRVGDFVVAIGNPFSLGQTVTTGIVSALGRSGLGIEGYENFIQTDASINPGNSGGALVNLRGELVGINTAIIAPAGGNVGIGFAIPVNMARASLQQILQHGEVKRGQIGVSIQDISADLREAFNLENGQKGVLLTRIEDASSADRAGLVPGDIVIRVNDQNTLSAAQLRSQIAMIPPGEEVSLTILREGTEMQFRLLVEEIDQSVQTTSMHPLLEGAVFADHEAGGVVLAALKPDSRAAYSGLRPGDLIVSANKVRVTDLRAFREVLKRSRSSILLQIQRGNMTLYLVIR
ncbi:DegQ family serine endoprotease [Neptuniibacter halophilus]|uniref:DegQ family serine endoprotease n=1 Tax=Neptuniibacter halophilus TaxID=651666 RepID=UPI002572FCD1|nr:DegQ family serine endoprotease [Neptuniibacter halophilus]